nr:LysR family transcriptional regulator [Anaeroplasmataceae bacterium]
AQKLFITQPAVTHHIKSLEHEYDIQIFENNRTFELTRQGAILAEYGRRMMDHSRELSEAIHKSLLPKKTLNLGITESSLPILSDNSFLDIIFEVYHAEATIVVLPTNMIFNELKEGRIDMAIVDTAYDDDSFDGVLLKTFTIHPVCYENGKFKEIKRITREMLKNNPIIFGDINEGMTKRAKHAIKNANITLSNSAMFYTNSSYALGRLIKNRDGIGFMYDEISSQSLDLKRMDLLNFKCSQEIYLLYSQNSFEKELLKVLVKKIKRWREQSGKGSL